MHARGREKRWHGMAERVARGQVKSTSWPSELLGAKYVVVEKGVWLRPRAPSGRAESTRTQGPWRPHVGSHQCRGTKGWLRPRAPSGRAESTRTQGPWRPHVGSHQCRETKCVPRGRIMRRMRMKARMKNMVIKVSEYTITSR